MVRITQIYMFPIDQAPPSEIGYPVPSHDKLYMIGYSKKFQAEPPPYIYTVEGKIE